MESVPETHRSRRAILTSALGAIGGLVVSNLVRPDVSKAATGDPITAGGSFTSGDVTRLETASGTPTFWANSNEGIALIGQSISGRGVVGAVDASPTSAYPAGVVGTGGGLNIGVFGLSIDGDAVYGVTGSGVGVRGRSSGVGTAGHNTGVIGIAGNETGSAANTDKTGIYGFANVDPDATGVWGDSQLGVGVVGTGDWGVFASGATVGIIADVGPGSTAVYGHVGTGIAPYPPDGVAVQATADSTSQVALSVTGKARFSRSGRTYVAAAHSSRVITMVGVSTSSYIIATPQSNRAGVFVQAVVPGSGKFTIYLNKKVTIKTYIGFLVIN